MWTEIWGYQFSTSCQIQTKEKSLLLIFLPWVEWSLRGIQMRYLSWTRAGQCKLWTNRLLDASWIQLKFVLENVYDKPKLQKKKTVFSCHYGGEMATSQLKIKMRNSNSQRITVRTIQKQCVDSPPSLTLTVSKNLGRMCTNSQCKPEFHWKIALITNFWRNYICLHAFTPTSCIVQINFHWEMEAI